MSRPVLTVVVNFFRLGPLADACLRTLAHSADPRIRFLLVDDASPDDTPQRLAASAALIPGAEVMTLPHNIGLAGARMAALDRLDTDRVTFLDGDDWVARGYYPALLDEVLARGVDWVRTDHIACTGRERVLVRIPDINRAGRVGSPREAILSAKTSSVDFAHAWSGVYHRRLADAGVLHFPPELKTAEDRPGIWALHLSVPAFTIARTVGIHYRLGTQGSLTQTSDVRQLAIIESLRRVRAVVEGDREADRFMPKVMRTWTGLLCWHWEHRGRLAPPLRRRLVREAGGLLDSAPQALLAEAIAQMPESRRQMIEALRRQAALLATVGAAR